MDLDEVVVIEKRETPQPETRNDWEGWSYVNSISKEDRWKLGSQRKIEHAKSLLT